MSSASAEVTPTPFPAPTKTAHGEISGIQTDVMSIGFTDKILITVSQGGRLAHWVHVPLDTAVPNPSMSAISNYDEDVDSVPSDLLPRADLTATTLLGGGIPDRNTTGQLVATQIASAIATKSPDDKRLLVVGLGLEQPSLDRTAFLELIGLILDTI